MCGLSIAPCSIAYRDPCYMSIYAIFKGMIWLFDFITTAMKNQYKTSIKKNSLVAAFKNGSKIYLGQSKNAQNL